MNYFMYEMPNGNKRSRNFTENEKQYLLSLVDRHKEVITSKKTSAPEIQRKNQAWEEITEAFNNDCTTGYRDTAQLRHFYNNIKHRCKKFQNEGNKKLADQSSASSSLNSVNLDYMNQSTQEFQVSVDGSRVQDDQRSSLGPEPADLGRSQDPLEGDDDEVLKIECDATISTHELYGRPGLGKRKLMKPTRSPVTKTMMKSSSEHLKRMYYRHKIELVNMQKKNEFTKFCNDQAKHEIEMQILRCQLKMAKEGKNISI